MQNRPLNRSCHVIPHNACESWGLIYLHTMRTVLCHAMCHCTGNNRNEQRRLGLDIGMIGAREETLGRTRSQTQEMFSPRNGFMERADLTMEDWILDTCLISVVTSGPTEPKTFKEAWHSPIEKERDNWRAAIQKEIRSMIERGVWRKTDRKRIPNNRRLTGNKWVLKLKRDGTYRA